MENHDLPYTSNKPNTSSFRSDFFRSILLGSTTVTVVTPISNYNNHLIRILNHQTKSAFTARRAFDGVIAYNTSVAPTIAISLIINEVLRKKDQKNNQMTTSYKQFAYSIYSGCISAMFGNFPEAIAQAQQLSTPKPSFVKILKNAVHHNGPLVINRGLFATAVKQVTFNIGFMWMMPMLINETESKGSGKICSLATASILTGLFVGISTAPSNTLRWHKHHQVDRPSNVPSYTSVLKNAFNNRSYGASLFSGWKPRSIMSAVSMLILHEGRKVLN